MTNNEKKAIIEKSALAYYSGFSGLEIKDIEYGIDDHIVFVAGAWYGKKSVHRAKICTTANIPQAVCLTGSQTSITSAAVNVRAGRTTQQKSSALISWKCLSLTDAL